MLLGLYKKDSLRSVLRNDVGRCLLELRQLGPHATQLNTVSNRRPATPTDESVLVAAMESYKGSYPYLPLNKVGFRYIILQPGAFDAEIQCSLVQDVDGTDKTPYEALSYVWGKSTDTVPVKIDGISFPATTNLESALRHLRRPAEARRLWVDAVCINQNDLDERSEQVCRMKDIYQQAQNVAIWLGREDEPATVYAKYDCPMEDAFQLARDIAAIPSQDDLETRLSSSASKDTFMVLSRLFHRTWFERVWVLQELVMAASAEVVCGKSSIPWQTLEDAYAQLTDFFAEELYNDWIWLNTAFLESWLPVFARFSVLRQQLAGSWAHCRQAGPAHALVFILSNFIVELEATDDRDRLYGILSIIQEDSSGPVDPVLVPDYRKPAAQLFADLARHLIRSTNTLTVLHAYDGIGDDSQPSWAPSWTRVRRPIYLVHEHTRVRPPGPEPCLRFTDDKILHTRGVELGRIHTTTSTLSLKDFSASRFTTTCRPLLRRWAKELLASGRVASPDDGKAFHAMCREAYLYGVQVGSRTLEENYYFYDILMDLTDKSPGEIVIEDVQALDMFCARTVQSLNEQCAFVTEEGAVGRTYEAVGAEAGDVVCLLQGGYAPFLVRPEGDGRFVLLGTCVLSGFMDAEVQGEMLGREEALRPFDLV